MKPSFEQHTRNIVAALFKVTARSTVEIADLTVFLEQEYGIRLGRA
jgi:hypothetical protein